jgi:hypothetical protein
VAPVVQAPVVSAPAPVAAAPTPAAPATTDPVAEALKTYGTEKKKAPGIGGIPKPPTASASPSMSYEDYVKQVGAGDKDILTQYAKAGEDEAAGMNALLAQREKDKPQGKAGESMEKYLKEKAISEPQRRQQNFQMALINAGLGIAAGNSQHWMQNVATGSKEAIKEYRAGIEKLDAAADERAKLMSGIEDARRAEAKGDWKELSAAKVDILKAQSSYRKAGIDAIVATTGANKKAAADIFTAAQTNERALQVAQMNNATELKKAGIMASAYGAKTSPVDKAVDNAAKEYDTWSKTPEAKQLSITNPAAFKAAKQQIFSQHFNMMGLPNPFSGGGADPELDAALAQYRQKS